MRLWIDDLRTPPDSYPSPGNPGQTISPSWWWAQTSKAAINTLKYHNLMGFEPFEEVSFDHDLGGDDTTRVVALWMCERAEKITWPAIIRVHTQNPVGGEWLMGTFERYAPETTQVTRSAAGG
jgi:hypothetical protein